MENVRATDHDIPRTKQCLSCHDGETVAMSDPKLRARRLVPLDADMSGLYYRMSTRGPKTQMPPLATKHADADGLALIEAWIEAL
jgi:hypothetical protein